MDLFYNLSQQISPIVHLLSGHPLQRAQLGEETPESLAAKEKATLRTKESIQQLLDGDLKQFLETIESIDKQFREEIQKAAKKVAMRRKSDEEVYLLYLDQISSIEANCASLSNEISCSNMDTDDMTAALEEMDAQLEKLLNAQTITEQEIAEDTDELDALTKCEQQMKEKTELMESLLDGAQFFGLQNQLTKAYIEELKEKDREAERIYDRSLVEISAIERQIKIETDKQRVAERKRMKEMHEFYSKMRKQEIDQRPPSSSPTGLHTEMKKVPEPKPSNRRNQKK